MHQPGFWQLNEYVTVVNVVLVEATSRIQSFRSILTQAYNILWFYIVKTPGFSDVTHSRSFGDIILENPTCYFAKPREIDMYTLSHENLPDHEVTKPRDLNLTKESKKWGCYRGLLHVYTGMTIWYTLFFKGSIFIVHLPSLQPSSNGSVI